MAEMQNTGNPLGSNDLKDLNDNLIVLDRQLNSEELTTTDRFGNVIPTVAGMRKTMEDLASQIATNELVPIDGSRSADKLSLKDGENSLELKAESGELKIGEKTALVASTVDDVKTVGEALNFTKDINVTGTLQQNGSGVITEAMNVAYITETFLSNDGLSWYRIWSDGLIEQGGYITAITATSSTAFINLVKSFDDLTYSVLITTESRNGTTNYYGYIIKDSKTTEGFTIRVNSDQRVNWYAKGYKK